MINKTECDTGTHFLNPSLSRIFNDSFIVIVKFGIFSKYIFLNLVECVLAVTHFNYFPRCPQMSGSLEPATLLQIPSHCAKYNSISSFLQANFQIDCNPDGQDLERIADISGLSKRVVQV